MDQVVVSGDLSMKLEDIILLPVVNIRGDEVIEKTVSLYAGETEPLNMTITVVKSKTSTETEPSWKLTYHTWSALCNRKLRNRNDIQTHTSHLTRPSAESEGLLYSFESIATIGRSLIKQRLRYKTANQHSKFNLNVALGMLLYLPDLDMAIGSYIAMGGDRNLKRGDIELRGEALTSDADKASASGDTRKLQQTYEVKVHEVVWNLAGTVDGDRCDAFSGEEMEFIAFLMVLSGFKGFETEEHFIGYSKRRCGAFASHMSYMELTWDKVATKIYPQSMIDFGIKMQFFPILRQTICATILDSDQKWASYCKTLMEDSQLTTFNFISIFLTDHDPTRAHFEPTVQNEIKKFRVAFENAKKKYGLHLRYAKLINPDDSTLSSSNWPTLTALALFALYIASGSQTLRRFKIRGKMTARLMEGLATPVNPKYLTRAAISSVTFSREDMEFLGIDPANFSIAATDLFAEVNHTHLSTLNAFLQERSEI